MKLSIAVAVSTIAIKMGAAWVTGSVGFLSDALESLVNLVAAVAGFFALKISAKPADHDHHFGHGKAEYVSALLEGAMIFVAAGMIIWSGVERLFDPQPLEQTGLGLILTVVASALNMGCGLALIKAGKKYRSATLEADGHHLMTDVVTSAGVLVGVGLIALTGWLWIDPLIALAVGVNILFTGYQLLKESLSSLLSEALPPEENEELDSLLVEIGEREGVTFAQLRTMAFGRQRLVYVIMTVDPETTVMVSHEVADRVEEEIDRVYPGAEVFIHVEPRGVMHRRLLLTRNMAGILPASGRKN
ncbi:transporter [Corynebacterium phocae]|uniref:Transporter n=1 Tax=Corynebacterium phocae TaxID=161895 RepID=A0A1L7D6Q7_9CORY|nr:cation diffusion facilitator family transporter [Corynebacterium phocae]APT93747.1 transporter [Corynebacterium phocae]KAA8723362.1 cation transporter [Corynebacterium phocae]